jgi:hypothetical protein
VSLKNGVGERADELHVEGAAVFIGVGTGYVADLALEGPHHRRLVDEGGERAGGRGFLELAPIDGGFHAEGAAFGKLRGVDGEQARLERGVEIETIDVVAGAEAKRDEGAEIGGVAGEDFETLARAVAWEVLRDGRLDPVGKAAGAAAGREPIGADVFSKRGDREHHEDGGGDEADNGEVARAAGFQVERAERGGVECGARLRRASEPGAAEGEAGDERGEAGEVECALRGETAARGGEGAGTDEGGETGEEQGVAADGGGRRGDLETGGETDGEGATRLAADREPEGSEGTHQEGDDADRDGGGLGGERERRAGALAGPNRFQETEDAACVERAREARRRYGSRPSRVASESGAAGRRPRASRGALRRLS